MSGKLIEIAYVVEDLASAIEHWTSDMGVGPFFAGIYEIPDQIFRGKPAPTRMKIAFGMSNGVLIELIEPISGDGCIFSEAGPGFNHIMFELADHDTEVARLEAKGFEVVQSGSFAGSSYSIVDTRSAIGCFTEVMACGPGLQGLIDRLRQASEAWDGKTEPVRGLFG